MLDSGVGGTQQPGKAEISTGASPNLASSSEIIMI